MQFRRFIRGDLALTSKMKTCLKKLTPLVLNYQKKFGSEMSNLCDILMGPDYFRIKVKIFEIELRRFCREDLSLTSKIKPCLKNLTPLVMQKYSIFSKCDMLQRYKV